MTIIPHVLALPFVLLRIGLALNPLLRQQRDRLFNCSHPFGGRPGEVAGRWNPAAFS